MKITPGKREAILVRTRDLKMARSVHAYVRGNTAQYYRWLAEIPSAAAIPEGPPIWICGDCHLGNLGPVADADRRIDIQIRDLDQTVIGNPAHDLIRLGLSLETAARSSDLPGVTIARMMEAMIEGYDAAMIPNDTKALEPDVVKTVRRRASGRGWQDLAKERLEDVEPTIPLGKRFWKLAKDERAAVDTLFEDGFVREAAFALAGLDGEGDLRVVVDAAYWRKGCSSLGTLRIAALIAIGRRKAETAFALVDIKEALKSVAPAAKGAKMPRDPAQRVVAGARAMSPNLGDRMIPAKLLGRAVVLRELAPQDLKVEVEQFSHKQAVAASRYLAHVVGRAHARQMTPEQREAWAKRLSRHDAAMDAPSWLWRSVVDLAALHEAGYLEHCRRFALGGDGRAA